MWRYLCLLVFLLAMVFLGVTVEQTPAYVLIATPKLAIELSLWFAIALIFVGFIIFYLILRLIGFLQ